MIISLIKYSFVFKVCKVLAGDVHAILDLTWYRTDEVDELFAAANVPRFLLDLTIKPFVVAMSKYLQAREAYDAIFIFQNERGIVFRI